MDWSCESRLAASVAPSVELSKLGRPSRCRGEIFGVEDIRGQHESHVLDRPPMRAAPEALAADQVFADGHSMFPEDLRAIERRCPGALWQASGLAGA